MLSYDKYFTGSSNLEEWESVLACNHVKEDAIKLRSYLVSENILFS